MSLTIRFARPEEASALRDLAHRSKAHWPYPADFLAAVRPLLQLDAHDIARDTVRVLERDGAVIGWHRIRLAGTRAELEDLWLEPTWIGFGHGRTLFEDAVGSARGGGADALEWDAEPFAEGFYAAMGGLVFDQVPSAVVDGRLLPRMRLELGVAGQPSRRNTSPSRP